MNPPHAAVGLAFSRVYYVPADRTRDAAETKPIDRIDQLYAALVYRNHDAGAGGGLVTDASRKTVSVRIGVLVSRF